jgi:hypothetical protein
MVDDEESSRRTLPDPMIGIALCRWKREVICSKSLKDELPINYNSGEFLAGVLPILDLRVCVCVCGCVCS